MIDTLEQLRSLYAAPGERARLKQLDHVDAHAGRFIQRSPLCVLASAGAGGRLLDASPRGGEPGFVKLLNPHTLLLPDAGGNNRLDTLENLLADPRLSLIFFVPGVQETLRVNGRARLRDEAQYLDRFARERQRPRLVIEVQVQEVYLHCAKAFMRSRLWDTTTWPERGGLPSMNQMIRDQLSAQGLTPPELESEAATLARYRAQLAQEATPEQE